MKLKELGYIINKTLELHPSRADLPVEIVLAESSIGPCASIGISYAGVGTDWDAYYFLINPYKGLVEKDFDREEYDRLKEEVMSFLWSKKDNKTKSFEVKQFLKCLTNKPDWIK